MSYAELIAGIITGALAIGFGYWMGVVQGMKGARRIEEASWGRWTEIMRSVQADRPIVPPAMREAQGEAAKRLEEMLVEGSDIGEYERKEDAELTGGSGTRSGLPGFIPTG